ncbi:hypothetical protein QBC43DRAFT_316322 [Cladorrhinum sp. PSN259]|nr:hypothetical protein QBC43DRAFT_316322 [Cladorrhinum sp. PSN259]
MMNLNLFFLSTFLQHTHTHTHTHTHFHAHLSDIYIHIHTFTTHAFFFLLYSSVYLIQPIPPFFVFVGRIIILFPHMQKNKTKQLISNLC